MELQLLAPQRILLVPRAVCGSSRGLDPGLWGVVHRLQVFLHSFLHKAPGTTSCCGWCWGMDSWICWGYMELRSLISGWISLCLLCLQAPLLCLLPGLRGLFHISVNRPAPEREEVWREKSLMTSSRAAPPLILGWDPGSSSPAPAFLPGKDFPK